MSSEMSMARSRHRFSALLGAALTILVLVGYACSSGIRVGDIRERHQQTDGPRSPLEALSLEVFDTISATDTSSPVWSPDSSRFIFADHYNGRLTLYDVDSKVTSTAYDSNAPPQGITDNRYNYENPFFFSDDEVLSGPSWGGDFSTSDPWGEVLVVDLANNTARPFGAYGTAPQVNRTTQEILLDTQEGLRLLDKSGTEVRTYEHLHRGRWAPEGGGFLALQQMDPYTPEGTLVTVDKEGAITSHEAMVRDAEWHPDGSGAVFVRPTISPMVYPSELQYGALYFFNFEDKSARPIAKSARNPIFLSSPPLVFYESPRGIGVSDLETTRIFHELQEFSPTPSPDGAFVSTIKPQGGMGMGMSYGYGSSEIIVYSVRFDSSAPTRRW